MTHRFPTNHSCRLVLLAIASCFIFLQAPSLQTPSLQAQETESNVIDFDRDIASILEEKCWHCHGEDDQESGLRLDLRPHLLRGGDSGLAALVPGNPDKSFLMEVINHVDEDTAMPPDDDKLPQAEIDLLARWIKEGAKWPGQMDAVLEETSDHWSFQAVVRPEVPHGDDDANPVDRFLLAKLAEHELSYSQPADARSLIRRVSIVLTGIAPTPEETANFICLLYTSPSPRDRQKSRMPSSA